MIVIMLPQYRDNDTTAADRIGTLLAQYPELEPTSRTADDSHGCFLYGLHCAYENIPDSIHDAVFHAGGAIWEANDLSANPPDFHEEDR